MLKRSHDIEFSFEEKELNRDSDEGRLLLFDLCIGGHHPGYIQHLISYWSEQDCPGYLDIVVIPEFLQAHQDVVDMASKYDNERVRLVPITSSEKARLSYQSNPIARILVAFREWKILCKYAKLLNTTHCLIMYFDTCWFPLVLGRKMSCHFSGIYFRPTQHYGSFSDLLPSWQEKLQQWRDKLTIKQILRHPQLKTLFCLDPFVIKHLDQFHSKVKSVYLPDPVQIYDNSDSHLSKLREKMGIHSDRRVFLLFGALTRRKGIDQLLQAIPMLSPSLCQKLSLLLVGPITAELKSIAQKQIAKISQSLPVQITIHDESIPDRQIQPYFQVADIVLAPYQRHVGMSAILVRAAAAQKPVLSSDYGLMGELVRRYHLGLAVDSTLPREIAKGITECLYKSPEQLGDRDQMKAFAEQNSAEDFARVIFQELLG